MLDNTKPNAGILLTRLAARLEERTKATLVTVETKNAALAAPDQVMGKLTKEVEIVLTGSAGRLGERFAHVLSSSGSNVVLVDIQTDYKDVHAYEQFKANVIKLIKKARKEDILICFVFEKDVKEKSHWIPFWEELNCFLSMKYLEGRHLPHIQWLFHDFHQS